MRFLRTNTAASVTVGPFLAVGDGVTPLGMATVTGCHMSFICEDGATTTLVLDADLAATGDNAMVHITNDDAGMCTLAFTAANLNRYGRGMVTIFDTDLCLPVFHEFQIISAVTYDAWFGTGPVSANVTQFGGTNLTATGGRPEINMSHIAGSAVSASTAQIGVNLVNIAGAAVSATTAQLGVNVVQVSADAAAADNLESYCDGTTPIPANATQIAGAAVSASTAQLGVNLVNIAGSAVATGTAQLGVNVVNYGGSAGSFASGRPAVNTTYISGAAVSTSAAQIGVNVIQVGATVQTARDLGASVLLSPGTGAGQVSLSSGTVTVGTNNDKTGYTASTVSDKTGYSIADATSDVVIADAVWNAATASYGTSNTYGSLVESGNVGGGAIVAASVTGAVGSIASGGIVAASIADNAIDAGSIATGAITAAKFAAGAIDAAAIADGAIDAATFASGAITAAAIAADAIGASELANDAVAEIADAVCDEVISTGHATANSLAKIIFDNLNAPVATADTAIDAIATTIGTAGAGLTALPLNLASYTGFTVANPGSANTTSAFATDLSGADDYWIGAMVLLTSGALSGQVKTIGDFADTNGIVTLKSGDVFTGIPQAGVTGVVLNR